MSGKLGNELKISMRVVLVKWEVGLFTKMKRFNLKNGIGGYKENSEMISMEILIS